MKPTSQTKRDDQPNISKRVIRSWEGSACREDDAEWHDQSSWFPFVCVIASATCLWVNYATLNPRGVMIAALACLLGATVIAWVTVHKKEWSPMTAPAYALMEGVALGAMSARLEARYPGIAIEVVSLTFATCLCLLAAYRMGIVRVTKKFNSALLAATSGVALFYFASFLLSLFGVLRFTVFAGGIPGIIISVVIVVIAALNLVSDFDFVEECSGGGLPKYMEWYTALGLMVTLVWLYTEILRLLSKARKTEEAT